MLFAELATVLPDAALEALLPPGGPAAELLLRAAPALTVALELAIGRLLFLLRAGGRGGCEVHQL